MVYHSGADVKQRLAVSSAFGSVVPVAWVSRKAVVAWLRRCGWWRCCLCFCELSFLNVSDSLFNVCSFCENVLSS